MIIEVCVTLFVPSPKIYTFELVIDRCNVQLVINHQSYVFNIDRSTNSSLFQLNAVVSAGSIHVSKTSFRDSGRRFCLWRFVSQIYQEVALKAKVVGWLAATYTKYAHKSTGYSHVTVCTSVCKYVFDWSLARRWCHTNVREHYHLTLYAPSSSAAQASPSQPWVTSQPRVNHE